MLVETDGLITEIILDIRDSEKPNYGAAHVRWEISGTSFSDPEQFMLAGALENDIRHVIFSLKMQPLEFNTEFLQPIAPETIFTQIYKIGYGHGASKLFPFNYIGSNWSRYECLMGGAPFDGWVAFLVRGVTQDLFVGKNLGDCTRPNTHYKQKTTCVPLPAGLYGLHLKKILACLATVGVCEGKMKS